MDQFSSTIRAFDHWIRVRLDQYFSGNDVDTAAATPPEVDWQQWTGHATTETESVVLLTALTPLIAPGFFDAIMRSYLPKGGDFPEFGGVKGVNTRYMLPTGDTALFLLAGTNPKLRSSLFPIFSTTHWFHKTKILGLEAVKDGEPKWSGKIMLSPELIEKITEGHASEPAFGVNFPARKIDTLQTWDDLVLAPETRLHLEDLKAWLKHADAVKNDAVLGKKINRGYRALFYGPSGTGKTFVAALLAKEFDRQVYRVDLSQVVSKYIGETEKNLEKVFERAENRNWILFFDEADALFGKRSNVQNAHDKYANQEVSYLLQRVEDFDGLVVLASNFKSNIDTAFLRRFNSIIHFAMPGTEERLQLWKKVLPQSLALSPAINLKQVAEKFSLSGATIQQAMHQAFLKTLMQQKQSISEDVLMEAIKKELMKEEKILRV